MRALRHLVEARRDLAELPRLFGPVSTVKFERDVAHLAVEDSIPSDRHMFGLRRWISVG